MTLRPIAREEARALELAPWGDFAWSRATDLDAGLDPSFSHVLRPTISRLVGQPNPGEILLDIGCGVGRLTAALEEPGRTVIAIDPSYHSLELAKEILGRGTQVIQQDIAQFARSHAASIDVCLAAMVMQDVVDLEGFVRSVRSVLRPGGRFVFAVTNPHYWPVYRGYSGEPWFAYDQEIFIRAPFRTSVVDYGIETLQIHRPLEAYASALAEAGLILDELHEPMMPENAGGPSWAGPHFLLGIARLPSS